MHDYLKPQQRGTKTREWAYRVLLASLLLVLAACQAAPRLTEVSLPTGTATTIPVLTIAVTPTSIAVPTPTPETAAPCSMDVLAYVFAAELRLPAGSPELGRQVDSQEAYQSAFGVSPDLPYDPNQPETGINWNIQQQLAAIGIELASNGRAVVLPEFAQGVGIEAVIRRDAPEAAIFFAGVNDGQAPEGALRVAVHASENGGYVVNLTDGAGNFYLLVEEGTGQTLGWPGDVGVETVTDVVQLANPAGGEVVPLKVNGCDWLLGVVGEDGRVAAALAMAPGIDAAALAWQVNPNPPEAVVTVPTDTPEQEAADLPQSCFDQEVIQETLDDYLAEHGQTYDQLATEIQAEIDNEPFPYMDEGPIFWDENEDGEVDSIAIHVFGRPIGVTTASIEHLPGMNKGDYVNCLLVANPRDGVIPMVVDGKIGGVWSPLVSLYGSSLDTIPVTSRTESINRNAMDQLIEEKSMLDALILSRVGRLPFQEPNQLTNGSYSTNYGWFPPYYQYVRPLLEQSYVGWITEDDFWLYTLAELRTALDDFDIGFFGSQIIVESEE